MKKKINFHLYLIGGVSIILTTIFITFIFYGLFQQQVKRDLKNYGQLLAQNYTLSSNSIMFKEKVMGDLRITIVKQNGEVVFESYADVSQMDNHGNRPEIIDAVNRGEGNSVRYSSTLENDTFYYALLLKDGNILRVSKQTHSIMTLFLGILPLVVGLATIIFLLCLILSQVLTRRIITPIEKMAENIEALEENIAYDELIPFARTIKMQNNHILKQMEYLEQEKNKIQMITDNMSEGLILLNNDKNILTINNSAIYLLSEKEKDYIGKNILYLSRNEQLNNIINSAADGESSSAYIFVEDKHLEAFANPVYYKENMVGLMCLLLDVTEKKESEKIRREFTANVSHELKTPLTSILGYAWLIKNGVAKQEDIKNFADRIHHDANRLILLINDIIKLSELDDPRKDMNLEGVDLYEIAKECVSSLSVSAQNKEVSLEVVGESHKVIANRSMMEELIYNLCDNAIRYNKPSGKVTITVKAEKENIILSVEDTGIGIPKEHQSRIFERFYCVDKSRLKATGGTGLGLSIVKHIVQQHNAKLVLDSAVNLGTKITITFMK
ncbi:two-component system, OmpR family, phosphate regulon sensor histidine kinase PhoR [Proteiniborus ethanoligenes]|uniref:histidine kinase n=1 Tax=Proteiniborus ethanoligenes TaxID=415015 RepID=A0A1H3Q0N3_9FIRM|nr:ATP-binding protein [Proteiniborus ethanoligenes]TAH63118.1 MAG: PAS domain-containing sensor histidine kinase [Gottschalkiaceae bacterium]SDZ07104.1 two-component system, OmpR family, phosphate regulon sensor histidine kinase PhoR [Proteiniborus ethanoligenes]